MKKPNKTEKALVERWHCTVRTIRRWKAAKAPLHDEAAMRTWLAGQRALPRGTVALLMADKRKARAKAHQAAADLSEGASSALRRLEAAEARAHAELQRAVKSGDPIESKTAENSWLRLCAQLLRYDLSLEESRRHSGEMLPRAEAERIVAAAGWFLSVSMRKGLERVAFEAVSSPAKDPNTLLATLSRQFDAAVMGSLGACRAWPFQGEPAPKWLHDAIERTLTQGFLNMTQAIREIAEALSELIRGQGE